MMFEVATTAAHRDAIARAHSERAAAFAGMFGWVKSLISPAHGFGAPAASGQ